MNKKNIIMNIITITFITISYLIIDLGIRYLSYEYYQFHKYSSITPILFSLSWISLFIGIFYLIPQKKRQIFYLISLVIFNLISLSQYLHLKILERFYGISDLFLIKEGSKYFSYALFETDIKILIIILISLVFGLIAIKTSQKHHETYRDKLYYTFTIIITIICIITFHICAYFQLGRETDNSFDASVSPLETYKTFNEPNKNMQTSGIYENTFRGIYIYIYRKITNNKEQLIKEIETYLEKNTKTLEPNKYTGIFKDKNIIVILLESVDTFLITDEVMPTIYQLSNEGLNFTNRYSPAFGGGQTINSEFALNTGLYTSLDGNIYNYTNTYKNSLANKFKNEGYEANSIHYNEGYFYNRKNFHLLLGYNNHYSLLDMDNIEHDKYSYDYDYNLIKSPKTRNLIIRDNKFLTFITTYTPHLPYDSKNPKCQENKYNFIIPDSQLACIYNLAHDTDKMVELLIEELKKQNKLNNTVIVLASDHYAYGYSNVTQIKNTTNSYLLQHTPLIIWSNDIAAKEIDIPVDTADILPTILNLFDIDYDPNLYVGEDAFATNRNNYIYFSSDVYYKDKILYDKTSNPGEASIYQEINDTIRFNNNLIESNYLKVD